MADKGLKKTAVLHSAAGLKIAVQNRLCHNKRVMSMPKANTKKNQDHLIHIYRSQLDEKLSYVKSLALSMGGCVEETLADAKEIVLGKTPASDLLPAIKKREEEINILQLKLSKACFRAIARQAPVAKDLRMMLTALNANTDLERMGDLAINIAYRAKKMAVRPQLNACYNKLKKMFNSTIEMTSLALESFVKESEKMSKKVLDMDARVDACHRQIIEEAKQVMQSEPGLISTAVDFIIVSGNLERIADHSTNIAEEIIFLQTGMDIRHGG